MLSLFIIAALVATAVAQNSTNPDAIFRSVDFTGTWSDMFYGQFSSANFPICSTGGGLYEGAYSNYGVITASQQGPGSIKGWWHEAGDQPDNNWGEFILKVHANDDNQASFTGQWWYGDAADGMGPYFWSGVRLSYTTPDSASECLIASGSGSLLGVWNQVITTPTSNDTDPEEKWVAICVDEDTRRARGSFEKWDRGDNIETNGALFGWSLLSDNSLFQGEWTNDASSVGGDYLGKVVDGSNFVGFWWNGFADLPGPFSFGGVEYGTSSSDQPSKDAQLQDQCRKYNAAGVLTPMIALVAAVAALAALL